MKVIIIGGHVTPALATIDALKKVDSTTSFYFFGRKSTREGDNAISAEYELIKSLNIPFVSITTGRLQRVFTRYTILSLLKIPIGLFQSFNNLLKIKPDVIVSFGGYLAVPVVVAGWLLRIPVVVHEQTLIPGLANKISARFASIIALSFEETRKFYIRYNTVVLGNPIRKEIFQQNNIFKIVNKNRPVIFVTGGNQGAHGINMFVFENINNLLEHFIIIHQTGNSTTINDYARSVEIAKSLKDGSSYYVYPYIGPEEIGDVFASCDLVLGRSGVNTMCEIIALSKKAILVPVPNHREQTYNAQYFSKLGFGSMIVQEELTPGLFISMANQLLSKPLDSQIILRGQKLIKQDAALVLAGIIQKIGSCML
ncbi:MAG: UDP-N-acetylglucosamine--N-acetylmuramyl-(pentapeptide) pyrophosphoryl-undecaprenol N-acetylglucosamine transferase [bacterium]|nr:UDP-N-acetylglucosamine--N-acetylmuramyl-(pentapeptide) pyrophosphoryl-undecaprenol N-acetylglucosamine transferase [bacterium]